MMERSQSSFAQELFVKAFWTNHFGPPWVLALLTLLGVAAVRFFAILSPYPLQELFFLQTVAAWALPLTMLTPSGRHQIGLTLRGQTATTMLVGALTGPLCAVAFFSMGVAIFGDTPDNWCVSIRNYLHLEQMRGLMSPLALFGLYALPAIFLQPVSEEILFRGFLQEALARRFSAVTAVVANSLLSALMYLSVHGIWHDASGYHLRVISVVIALCLMTFIGAVFNVCRLVSGSLWPAVAAHAGFSVTLLALSIHRYM